MFSKNFVLLFCVRFFFWKGIDSQKAFVSVTFAQEQLRLAPVFRLGACSHPSFRACNSSWVLRAVRNDSAATDSEHESFNLTQSGELFNLNFSLHNGWPVAGDNASQSGYFLLSGNETFVTREGDFGKQRCDFGKVAFPAGTSVLRERSCSPIVGDVFTSIRVAMSGRCFSPWFGSGCDTLCLGEVADNGTCVGSFVEECGRGGACAIRRFANLMCGHNFTCMNGGTCHPASGSAPTPTCSCPKEYTGKHCDSRRPVCAYNDSCKNGATCVDKSETDFSCTCATEFKGQFCTERKSYCELHPDACKNGGTCVPGPPHSCTCPTEFKGARCDVRKSMCELHRPCKHGGSCTPKDADSYTCACTWRYRGVDCQIKKTQCELKNPCRNGGACLESGGVMSCNCTERFHGEFCGTPKTPCDYINPCQNGGQCKPKQNTSDTFYCNCSLPFKGTFCEIKMLPCDYLSSRCQHNSICKNSNTGGRRSGIQCICTKDFKGQYCSNRTKMCERFDHCRNGGTCINYNVTASICRCPANWAGANCTADADECRQRPSPCKNEGVCSNRERGLGYWCECKGTGYKGLTCVEDIDECMSKAVEKLCKNSGNCKNIPGKFECVCKAPYHGDYCEKCNKSSMAGRLCLANLRGQLQAYLALVVMVMTIVVVVLLFAYFELKRMLGNFLEQPAAQAMSKSERKEVSLMDQVINVDTV